MIGVPSSSSFPVLDAHRTELRAAFVRWLVEEGCNEVLDVGAGSGELLVEFEGAGVRGHGIEASPERLAKARSRGLEVYEGSAEALTAPDSSIEWVCLRHVLHHLRRPEVAVREAIRVAKFGVMIAEPVSDTGLPMHAATVRLERLLRSLDRLRGDYHAADIPAPDIVTMLPRNAHIEVRVVSPLVPLPAHEVNGLIERSAAGRELSRAELEEKAAVLDASRLGYLAPSGSLMVLARLR